MLIFISVLCYNRTYVELKLVSKLLAIEPIEGYNRTYVELK